MEVPVTAILSSVIGGFAYMDPMQSVDLVQVLSPQVKQ